LIKQGCSDFYIHASLAHTKRISDAYFLYDPHVVLFGIVHEAITVQNHSLYCIDEPVGMVIPIYIIDRFIQEKTIGSEEENSLLKKMKRKNADVPDSFKKLSEEFMFLFGHLDRSNRDKLVIGNSLRNYYLSAYDDVEERDIDFETRLFLNSIAPAKDNKLGWSYIMAQYPYYSNYKAVREIVDAALAHHDGDILRVCRNYTSMATPKEQFYKTDEDSVNAALDELENALFK
jgi:hypothetical protein